MIDYCFLLPLPPFAFYDLDSHENAFLVLRYGGKLVEGMRDIVAPMYDQAYGALLEDLVERGLLDNPRGVAIAQLGVEAGDLVEKVGRGQRSRLLTRRRHDLNSNG